MKLSIARILRHFPVILLALPFLSFRSPDCRMVGINVDAAEFSVATMPHKEAGQQSHHDSAVDSSSSDRQRGRHALWLQAGLGFASATIAHLGGDSNFYIHAGLSAHFRRNQRTISIGADAEGDGVWAISTMWATYGLSDRSPGVEATLSGGIGVSRWHYHDDDGGRGSFDSSLFPGVMLRAEVLLHPSQVLGLGFVISYHLSKETSSFVFGLTCGLGWWDW